MKKRLAVLLWITIGLAAVATAASKKFTLVIDAGHGGHDAGAIGAITKEKTINLNVALAFGRMVERNCPDVKVIYTRKTDVFIPLHERADIANRNKADLFISIHTNSLPKRHIARGMETYTLGMHRANDNLDVAKRENSVILIEKDYKQRYQGFDPNSAESYIIFEIIQDKNMAQSVELAKLVQKHTCSIAKRPDKGVKQAGFLVLRETSMPSCLIELGFISTPDEERFLDSDKGVELMGRGIYQAFCDYKRNKFNGNGTNVKAEVKEQQEEPTDNAPRESKKKRRKSKMAQELADAREGSISPEAPAEQPAEVLITDTIAAAVPDVAEPTPPVAATKPASNKQSNVSAPVFKVQIIASSARLKTNDRMLKGENNAEYYEENGLFKYTVGASTNYNEIYQLRKQLTTKFPEAFIIAFKEGKKMDVRVAIQEFKNNKNK